MPFAVDIERHPDHVRFVVSGPASLKNYFDLIDAAAREAAAHGDTLGLVDLRGVAGRLVFTDQIFIGDVVGQKLAHMKKLAALVSAEPESYNSPKVAKRMGVNLQSFADEGAALRWLREPDSA